MNNWKREKSNSDLIRLPQIRLNESKIRHKAIIDALEVLLESNDNATASIRDLLYLGAAQVLKTNQVEKIVNVPDEPIEKPIQKPVKTKGKLSGVRIGKK